ncbi:hypothetical protein ACF061_09335 [Streptomyces sp. NPDC015220]|uniref:hypothetical protein n=1 Tax=Streptomyces sp. NPDC015220 TaxID=3364947 RepID=UPI0036FC4053
MLRQSEEHGGRSPLRGGPDPRRVRLLALAGVVACAAVLPLTVASAGQVGDQDPAPARSAVRSPPLGDDGAPPAAPRRSTPLLLGLGLATAARCGPEVASPEGVEAQTCVLSQGEETWARAYYRNATGEPLDAALTLMGPGDRTVRARCAPQSDDEPQTCETPREHTRGAPAGYTAVAEFARPGGQGSLLLRSGSNSPASQGS